MGIPLSEPVKKAIDANNFAHVATLMKDGSPRSRPCGSTVTAMT